ncbi:MAG: GNAT family protein [Bacteroidales bacterium]|jgi:RimJ/RimL family protein N-acetyltransferase|nr:GNAT family protein [Bacteroidales bacterium]
MDYRLRKLVPGDAASMARYANNRNVARYLTDEFPHPYTEEDARIFIERVMKSDSLLIRTIEVNGEASGAIGVHPQSDVHRRNAEMGYWLAEDYWGRGIVTRAIGEMVDMAFGELDIDRIFARPFSNNPRSQRVLEKTGFILEGRFEKTLIKNGEYLDELIYAVRKEHWRRNKDK